MKCSWPSQRVAWPNGHDVNFHQKEQLGIESLWPILCVF
jgi:hypothetical protein